MWDDVQIGKRYPHCGARLVAIPSCKKPLSDQPHSISENQDEYWIGHLVLDLGMRIDKRSKEGQKLKAMIEGGKKLSVILKWLDQLVLSRIKVDILYKAIQNMREECVEKGMRRKQNEIVAALGIQGGYYL